MGLMHINEFGPRAQFALQQLPSLKIFKKIFWKTTVLFVQPIGRALTSDRSVNSFIMVVNEKIIFCRTWTKNLDWT